MRKKIFKIALGALLFIAGIATFYLRGSWQAEEIYRRLYKTTPIKEIEQVNQQVFDELLKRPEVKAKGIEEIRLEFRESSNIDPKEPGEIVNKDFKSQYPASTHLIWLFYTDKADKFFSVNVCHHSQLLENDVFCHFHTTETIVPAALTYTLPTELFSRWLASIMAVHGFAEKIWGEGYDYQIIQSLHDQQLAVMARQSHRLKWIEWAIAKAGTILIALALLVWFSGLLWLGLVDSTKALIFVCNKTKAVWIGVIAIFVIPILIATQSPSLIYRWKFGHSLQEDVDLFVQNTLDYLGEASGHKVAVYLHERPIHPRLINPFTVIQSQPLITTARAAGQQGYIIDINYRSDDLDTAFDCRQVNVAVCGICEYHRLLYRYDKDPFINRHLPQPVIARWKIGVATIWVFNEKEIIESPSLSASTKTVLSNTTVRAVRETIDKQESQWWEAQALARQFAGIVLLAALILFGGAIAKHKGWLAYLINKLQIAQEDKRAAREAKTLSEQQAAEAAVAEEKRREERLQQEVQELQNRLADLVNQIDQQIADQIKQLLHDAATLELDMSLRQAAINQARALVQQTEEGIKQAQAEIQAQELAKERAAQEEERTKRKIARLRKRLQEFERWLRELTNSRRWKRKPPANREALDEPMTDFQNTLNQANNWLNEGNLEKVDKAIGHLEKVQNKIEEIINAPRE